MLGHSATLATTWPQSASQGVPRDIPNAGFTQLLKWEASFLECQPNALGTVGTLDGLVEVDVQKVKIIVHFVSLGSPVARGREPDGSIHH